MSDVNEYGQVAVSADLEFGSGGGRILWNGTEFQAKENDGTTPARLEAADPVNPLDVVNFRTVEGLIDGIVWKEACRVATATALTGWTSSGSGVGKTLTSPNDNVSNNDFDGVTVAVGERILVNDGPTAVDNGIYTMLTLADGAGQNAILRRAEDADQDVNAAGEDEIKPGATVHITEGTTLSGDKYTVLGAGPITIDTDAMNWTLTGSTAGINPLFRTIVLGTGATQNIGALLPVGAKVQWVKLNITTAYSGGATLEIRDDGVQIYQTTSENNPQKGNVPNLFKSEVEGSLVVAGTRQLQAIISGAPGAGAAVVVVFYLI